MQELNYRLINEPGEVTAACERLADKPEVGFDTETTSLSPFEGRVRLVQLAAAGEPVYVFDLDRLVGEGDDDARRERARTSDSTDASDCCNINGSVPTSQQIHCTNNRCTNGGSCNPPGNICGASTA